MKNIIKAPGPTDTSPNSSRRKKCDLEDWFNWLDRLCKNPDSTKSRELNQVEASWLHQKLVAEELQHDAYLYADRL